MVYIALLPWQFFSISFGESANSLVSNAAMISKVYFPRLIIPTSKVVIGFVDFGISCFVLAGIMVFHGFMPSWQIIFLPIFMAIATAMALGLGYLFASLTVSYRDFRHITPFIIQFGFYTSPIGFSTAVIPENWRFLYTILNPLVGIIEGARWAVLGKTDVLEWTPFLLSVLWVLALLVIGILFFRKTEKKFADVI